MRKKYSELDMESKKIMANNLRSILGRKGISQKDLAELTGLTTSAVSDYVTGKTMMSPGKIQIIADALKVKKSEIDPIFNSKGQIESFSRVINLPIVGRISCGEGVIAYADIEGYESTPQEWLNGGAYFYLRAKGDSMTDARIQDGDLLLIREQHDVENGEIAAVIISDEAVLKRLYKKDNLLILQPENSKYEPIILSGEEINNAKVIGKLVRAVIKF